VADPSIRAATMALEEFVRVDTLMYLTEPLMVSHETTCTLVKGDTRWLVDRVEVSAQGEPR